MNEIRTPLFIAYVMDTEEKKFNVASTKKKMINLKIPAKFYTDKKKNNFSEENILVFYYNCKHIFFEIFYSLVIIAFLLIAIAFYTLAERKIMGGIQRRKGPNIAGFWGFFQPLTDGIKLIAKENIIPKKSNYFLFIIAPLITFTCAFLL